jgi:hypothetical protein
LNPPPEKLVQDGAVEAFGEVVCPRRVDFGEAVFDAVEVEIEFVRMVLGAAELVAIVGEYRADRQVEGAVERQDVVVQHRHRRLRLLGDVQEAEGVGAIGVNHGTQVDLADALETADEEGVGRKQRTGAALSTAFSALAFSSASQRLTRVPRPMLLRIFWMVIEEIRAPSSPSWRQASATLPSSFASSSTLGRLRATLLSPSRLRGETPFVDRSMIVSYFPRIARTEG